MAARMTRMERPESPAALADIMREINGAGPDMHPVEEGMRYQMGLDGTHPDTIPIPPTTGADFDTPPLNTPENLARMQAREFGIVTGPAAQVIRPASYEEDEDEVIEPVQGPEDNTVNLDAGLALFSGHLLELTKTELRFIRTILVKALERSLKEEFARVSAAYKMQKKRVQRKPRAKQVVVPKASGRKRRASAPTASGPTA